MQIKIAVRYHFTWVRMTIIAKSTNNKCWLICVGEGTLLSCSVVQYSVGCSEKGTLVHCGWEGRLAQPLWKTVWKFLKKLKMELPFDPEIPLLGLYPLKS